MQASSTHPLLILSEIDSACREIIGKTSTPLLPDKNTWSGIGFRIGKDQLVIQNIYIDEVVDANFRRNLSIVPGAKAWLIGLISLRGQPLAVIDFKQFLFGEASIPTEHSRLVVIKNDNYISGLFLEDVCGLKQFEENTDSRNNKKNDQNKKMDADEINKLFSENISLYIDKTFSDDGALCGNLSIPRLISNTDFANAAR